MTAKLVNEVKGQVPETRSSMIKGSEIFMAIWVICNLSRAVNVVSNFHVDAARTYFPSIVGMQKLKASGKYSNKCAQQRHRNRIIRVCIVQWEADDRMGGQQLAVVTSTDYALFGFS